MLLTVFIDRAGRHINYLVKLSAISQQVGPGPAMHAVLHGFSLQALHLSVVAMPLNLLPISSPYRVPPGHGHAAPFIGLVKHVVVANSDSSWSVYADSRIERDSILLFYLAVPTRSRTQ